MNKYLIFIFLSYFSCLMGHEGHKHHDDNITAPSAQEEQIGAQFGNRPKNWSQWVGGFHFIFLNFPIALITMTAISELLFSQYPKRIFDHSARFMLIAAAIFATPTALLGLIYSYSSSYENLLSDFLQLHMWFGITTAVISIIVAFLRERYGVGKLYYTCLTLLFFLVNMTGFFGGGLTFGPYHYLPP